MATDPVRVPTDGPPEVAEEVHATLRAATNQLLRRFTALVEAFHQRMLSIEPAVAQMTHGGRPMCQRTVMTALENAQSNRPLAATAATVEQIGRDNHLDGLTEAHLDAVTHSMLYAVRAVCAEEWSSSLSSAWVQYLMWFQANLRLGIQAQSTVDRDERTLPPGGRAPVVDRQHPSPAGYRGDPDTPEQPAGELRKDDGRRPAAPGPVAIDTIVVSDGNVRKTLTAAQWKALPFVERMKYLNADPEFYAGNQQIGLKEAIVALRA